MMLHRAIGPAALCAMLLAAAVWAPAALAGSSSQPEISDPDGDGTRDSRDIKEVWFGGETNTTIDATMNVSALESFTGISDISNLPTTEYEVYFTVGERNYSVACTVPVHGPLGLRIVFEVRTVTYSGNGTASPTETEVSTFTGSYNTGNHTLVFPIPKSGIGDPRMGTHLTKTWAAVWNKNYGQPNRTLEDRAPNNAYGLDYIVRGTPGQEVIDVEMTASESVVRFKPNENAVFRVDVYNNGTSQVTILLTNSTPSKGWECTIIPENMTLQVNRTLLVTVTVSCPRSVANNTTEVIQLTAIISTGKQNHTQSVSLTAITDFIPPKEEQVNIVIAFFKWAQKNPQQFAMYLGAIVAVVVALSVAAVLVRRRKQAARSEQLPLQPAKG